MLAKLRLFCGTLIERQLARFLFVGLLNTAFSYCMYVVFLFIGFNYALSNLFALILGIIFGFRMQGRYVFMNHDIRLFGKFLLVWGSIYFVAITVIGKLISVGVDAYTAGALAIPVTVVASYLLQKYFVFRKPSSNPRL